MHAVHVIWKTSPLAPMLLWVRSCLNSLELASYSARRLLQAGCCGTIRSPSGQVLSGAHSRLGSPAASTNSPARRLLQADCWGTICSPSDQVLLGVRSCLNPLALASSPARRLLQAGCWGVSRWPSAQVLLGARSRLGSPAFSTSSSTSSPARRQLHSGNSCQDMVRRDRLQT